jgi:hypothetical protein
MNEESKMVKEKKEEIDRSRLNHRTHVYIVFFTERGSQRRRHAVREQAPEPEGEGGARQHPDGGGDPQRDPQQREGGVPDRRHVQARQGHRAVPLQEEDQGPGTCVRVLKHSSRLNLDLQFLAAQC